MQMKAHRKVFSTLLQVPAHTTASIQLLVANGEVVGGLSVLELRILGELNKVRCSRLSENVATCTKDPRSVVETGLQRMLDLGLVRQSKNSKRGFSITEAGRAARLAAHRLSPVARAP